MANIEIFSLYTVTLNIYLFFKLYHNHESQRLNWFLESFQVLKELSGYIWAMGWTLLGSDISEIEKKAPRFSNFNHTLGSGRLSNGLYNCFTVSIKYYKDILYTSPHLKLSKINAALSRTINIRKCQLTSPFSLAAANEPAETKSL